MTLTPHCPECEWWLRPKWRNEVWLMGCDECGFTRFPSTDEMYEITQGESRIL